MANHSVAVLDQKELHFQHSTKTEKFKLKDLWLLAQPSLGQSAAFSSSGMGWRWLRLYLRWMPSPLLFPEPKRGLETGVTTLEFSCAVSLSSMEGSNFVSALLQGISYWNVKSNLGLTDRNILVRFCLKICAWSWGLDIWVSSTNFQKSNIDWPKQPPTERC